MENYSEYIDDYFSKRLTPEQSGEFDQRIAADPDFAAEVAFYLSAKQSLEQVVALEKKESFRKLLEADPSLKDMPRQGSVRKIWIYRSVAAAAVLFIAFLGWYFYFFKSTSPGQLADRYIIERLEVLSVKMSGSVDSIQTGLRLYNEKKFDSSLQQFETIVQRDTGNYLAKNYLGIVYLRLDNYDKALEYFKQGGNYALFSNPAIFYQALTLLKRNQPGDKQQAKQLLQQVVDQNLEEKETAQRWLQRW